MEEQRSNYLIPLAIVVAGALVAGAVYYGGKTPPAYIANNAQTSDKITVKPLSSTDHILNAGSAKVYVIEYSDLECPFCKVFHATMHQVVNDYGSKVAWVYRQFPIPSLHTRAMKEAEASECVAELGGNDIFWKYIDKIFATTGSNDSLDPAQLPAIATSLGIPLDQFNTCLNSNKYEAPIKESMQDGLKAGAQGTPYSIIVDSKGKVLDTIAGAEPIDQVKVKLDTALK